MTDSRCSQVGWLLVGFTWGTMRLMTLLLDVRGIMSYSSMLRDSNDENSHWGFGQVVAIVLLIAPLVTFVELFNKGTSFTFYVMKRQIYWLDYEEFKLTNKILNQAGRQILAAVIMFTNHYLLSINLPA